MGVGPRARQKQSTDLVFNHVTLGADDTPLSLAAIEKAHAKDAEYSDFRTRLTEYLIHLRAPGPRGKRLALKPTDKVSHLYITYTVAYLKYHNRNSQITPYRYVRVNYESLETWRLATDRLRCSPQFFGHPRYDGVIFQADEHGTLQFGKLKDVFIVEVADKKYPIAFIDAYHVVSGPRTTVDEALGLCRLRMDRQHDHGTMFIHVDSIVRGALLVQDHAVSVYDDYFVIDIIDSDMFLRLVLILASSIYQHVFECHIWRVLHAIRCRSLRGALTIQFPSSSLPPTR